MCYVPEIPNTCPNWNRIHELNGMQFQLNTAQVKNIQKMENRMKTNKFAHEQLMELIRSHTPMSINSQSYDHRRLLDRLERIVHSWNPTDLEWIRVEDQLPDDDQEVYILLEGHFFDHGSMKNPPKDHKPSLGKFSRRKGWCLGNYFHSEIHVAAWMPTIELK